jgi:ankyrin repeat protein
MEKPMKQQTVGEVLGTAVDKFLTVSGLLPLGSAADVEKQLAEDPGRVNQPINEHTADRLLHLAAARENLEVVKVLLANGADVNVRGQAKRAPLHCAATAGNIPIAEELLGRGADLEATDDSGDTPLCAALRSEKWECARFFEQRGGRVDLNTAICLGQLERVQALLAENPAACRQARAPQDLLADAIRHFGRNRLPAAKEGEDHSEAIRQTLNACRGLVERLLELGADANSAGALEQAVQLPHTVIAQLLLERGASPDRGGFLKNLLFAFLVNGKEMRTLVEEYCKKAESKAPTAETAAQAGPP